MVVIAAWILVVWFVLNVALPLLGIGAFAARKWVETCPEPTLSRPGLTRAVLVHPAREASPRWREWVAFIAIAGGMMIAGWMMTGCGGATTDVEPTADATAAAVPDAGAPAHTAQGEPYSTLPRCLHSPDPAPGSCQQMRFGERVGYDTEGWCAFWVPCP